MSITIGNYTFEGPFTSTSSLKDQSGVYAILGNNSNGNWNVVDIGESETIRTRVETHDREPCWKGQKYSTLAAAAFYTDANNRMAIEKQLRGKYDPPCGQH